MTDNALEKTVEKAMGESTEKIRIENLRVNYPDGTESLKGINMVIHANCITVLFGPAGGGKSTLLRTINRLNDLIAGVRITGRMFIDGVDILDPKTDIIALRRRAGIVFSRPMPLPLTIYGNVSYALELSGERSKAKMDAAVERALRQARLWDEVYDRLSDPANALSGGQQQRLCIARALVLEPDLLLLDEPTSALDPLTTADIEETLEELKKQYTIIIAPHNTQQSVRMADYAAFFLQGELIEYAPGREIFTQPKDARTLEYIEGRFG